MPPQLPQTSGLPPIDPADLILTPPSEFETKIQRLERRMADAGFPVVRVGGSRTAEEQQRLYQQGRGTPGPIVTNADGINTPSRHQSGDAADFAFSVNGQPSWDESHPWDLLGKLAQEEGLEWGGNFQSRPDRPHVQAPSRPALPPIDPSELVLTPEPQAPGAQAPAIGATPDQTPEPGQVPAKRPSVFDVVRSMKSMLGPGVAEAYAVAEKIPLVRDALGGMVQGAAGLASGAIGAAAWTGLVSDQTATEAAEAAEVLTPELATKSIADDPGGTLGNPEWWATMGGQAAGSMLGLGTVGALTKAFTAMKYAPAVAAALAESLVEGGGTYTEAIQAGASPEEAGKAAAMVTSVNLPLLGFTNIPVFKGFASEAAEQAAKATLARRAARVAGAAASESGQESTQQIASNVAAQQYFDPSRPTLAGVPESAVVGGMAGGGMRAVSPDMIARPGQPAPAPAAVPPPSPEAPAAETPIRPAPAQDVAAETPIRATAPPQASWSAVTEEDGAFVAHLNDQEIGRFGSKDEARRAIADRMRQAPTGVPESGQPAGVTPEQRATLKGVGWSDTAIDMMAERGRIEDAIRAIDQHVPEPGTTVPESGTPVAPEPSTPEPVATEPAKESPADVPRETPAYDATRAKATVRGLDDGVVKGSKRVPFPVVGLQESEAVFKSGDMDRATLREVQLDQLVMTQPSIEVGTVEAYLDKADASERMPRVSEIAKTGHSPVPMAYERDGKYYVSDGAHRLVGEWAKGRASARMLVVPAAKAPQGESLLKPEPTALTSDVSYVDPKSIAVDASRFQFKSDADSSGVTREGRIAGPWNENLAGIVLAWKDPETDKTFVVNGHHRLDAAKRLGAPRVLVRFIDAKDAGEARVLGALANIAEDKGTPVDAAKVLRTAQYSPERLAELGIPKNSRLSRQGMALANLSDPIFQKIATGEIEEGIGVAIGEANLSPENQAAVVTLIERQAAKGGRDITPRIVTALIEDVKAEKSVEKATDQPDMFSALLGEDRAQSIAVEKAFLRDRLMQALSRDQRLFAFVAKRDRAEKLGQAGNRINVKGSEAEARQAAEVASVVERLAQSKGPVSDALTKAAERLAGGDSLRAVEAVLHKDVREAVQRELAGTRPAQPRVRRPRAGDVREAREGRDDQAREDVATTSAPSTDLVRGGLSLMIEGQRQPVEIRTMEDVGRFVDALRDRADQDGPGGAGRFPRIDVVDADGVVVAHTSYNGRIWEGRREDWTSQTKEIERADGRGYGKPGAITVEPKAEPSERKFASTQINLPPEAAHAVRRLGAMVQDVDLAEDGREDSPHVTVKYGLHSDDPAPVQSALSGATPLTLELGPVEFFPASESGKADVVYVSVKKTPDLVALNEAVAGSGEATDTHPTYKPHVTIAYVKPGAGAFYAKRFNEKHSLDGRTFAAESVEFSPTEGEKTQIPLAPKAESKPADTTILEKIRDNPDAGSWVAIRRASGEVIGEFTDTKNVAKFNPKTVEVLTAQEYLARQNAKAREQQATEKPLLERSRSGPFGFTHTGLMAVPSVWDAIGKHVGQKADAASRATRMAVVDAFAAHPDLLAEVRAAFRERWGDTRTVYRGDTREPDAVSSWTLSQGEAEKYANMRGGTVHERTISPDDILGVGSTIESEVIVGPPADRKDQAKLAEPEPATKTAPEPRDLSFTPSTLQQHFGITEEQAEASVALADAMGLPREKIRFASEDERARLREQIAQGKTPDRTIFGQDDLLDTGEVQPRLPGEVGDVRDQEVEHPTLGDLSFALEGQAEDRRAVQETLFGAPVKPKKERAAKPRRFDQDTLFQGGVTDTPAFKAWFGDSKIVAPNGKPLVVYHGTPEEFSAFDIRKTWTSPLGASGGLGFYFSPDPTVAQHYGWRGSRFGQILPVYLSIKNPKRIEHHSPEAEEMHNSKTDSSRLRSELIAQGYDGAITPYGEIVAFWPEQIKSAIGNRGTFDPSNQNILYQEGPGTNAIPRTSWYYSNTLKALETWQKKGTADQLLAHLKKHKGAMDEAEAIGLTEWLKQQEGSFSRADVQAFVESRQIQIQEVVRQETDVQEAYALLRDQGYRVVFDEDNHVADLARIDRSGGQHREILLGEQNDDFVDDLPDDVAQAFEVIERAASLRDGEDGSRPRPKFNRAELNVPGGSNYREILLTLPAQPQPVDRMSRDELAQWYEREVGYDPLADDPSMTTEDLREAVRGFQAAAGGQVAQSVTTEFRGGHWDEPNVLAHVRMDDREIDGKRTLFLQEVQSDFALAARKQGVRRPYRGRTVEAIDADMDAVVDELGRREPDAEPSFEQWQRHPDLHARQTELQNERNEAEWAKDGTRGAPFAPFVTSNAWQELVFKRVLAYASEHGYDAIAWTPGSIQQERYDLSKQVKSISWEPVTRKTPAQRAGDTSPFALGARTLVTVQLPDGDRHRLGINERGEVVDSFQAFAGKTLDEIIGKEPAEKILAVPSGELSGEGLKIGGQWAINLYDKALRNIANAQGKKYGVKATTAKLDQKDDSKRPHGVVANRYGGFNVMSESYEILHTAETHAQAEAWMQAEQERFDREGGVPVHFLDLPQSMRESIRANGLPLFHGEKAAVEFTEGGEAVLHALSSPDASSGVHEIAHIARRFLFDRNLAPEDRLGITDEDIRIAEDSAGVKDGKWERPHEEWFARAFERYLRDGKSPSSRLDAIFAKFADWLSRIYQTLTGSAIDVKVSPEMRKVFDRLVTRSERITSGEAATEGAKSGETAERTVEFSYAPKPNVRHVYRHSQKDGAPVIVREEFHGRRLVGVKTYKEPKRSLDEVAAELRREGKRITVRDTKPADVLYQADRLTDSPAFRRWFGDSKVVDEQGQPLRVFHGTSNPTFTNFARRGGMGGRLGFWFASTPQAADQFARERYAGQGPAVYPVYLAVQNPMEYQGWSAFVAAAEPFRKGGTIERGVEGLRRSLMARGHDGIVIRGSDTDSGGVRDDWAVFRPEQIKSATGNRGTFDPDSPNILFQEDDPTKRPTVKTITRKELETFARLLNEPLEQLIAEAEANGHRVVTSDSGKAGNINLDKLDISDEAKEMIREIVAKNDDFKEQRRGTRSWAETVAASEAIPRPSKVTDPGKAFNAEELESLASHVATTTNRVLELAEDVAEGSASKKVEFAQRLAESMVVDEVFAGATAEAGRALNILKRIKQARMTDDDKFLQAAIKEAGGGVDIDKIAGALRNFHPEDRIGKYKYIRGLNSPDMQDVFWWWMYTSMLSGPLTHARNLIGNFSQLAFATARMPAAVLADTIHAKRTGEQRTAYLGEINPSVFGMAVGAKDGAWKALMMLRNGFTFDDLAAADFRHKEIRLPKFVRDRISQKASDRADIAINVVSRSLEAGDLFFRSIRATSELYAQAYVSARNHKLTPGTPEFVDFMEHFIAKPPKKALKSVQREAARAVLRDDPGKVLHAVLTARQIPLVRWIVPFAQAPGKIMLRGVEASPAGFYLAHKAKKAGTLTTREIAQLQGSAMLGTSLLLPLAGLVSMGLVSGSGPDDRELRAQLYRQGWQPNSVFLPGLGWVSYQMFQPLSFPLAALANIREAWIYESKDPDMGTLGVIAAKTINSILDASYLQGLSRLMGALQQPERWGASLIEQNLNTLVGFAGFRGQVARAIDPTFRDPQTTEEAIKAATPGTSFGVRPRLDVFGDESERGGTVLTRLFLPFQVSGLKGSALEAELLRLKNDVQVGFPYPGKKVTINRTEYTLTADEYAEFLKESGGRIKQQLERRVADRGWMSRTDEAKAREIRAIVEAERARARPALYRKVLERAKQESSALVGVSR